MQNAGHKTTAACQRQGEKGASEKGMMCRASRTLNASKHVLAILLLFVTCLCQAETDKSGGVLTIQLENDLWGSGKDGHYTHGTMLTYVPNKPIDGWLKDAAMRSPFFAANDGTKVEYLFGQNIFTPDDISIEELIPDDRPYAGWLYVGMAFLTVSEVEGKPWRTGERFEVDIGVVGPASGAEWAQKTVHELVGSDEPMGWDNQLENELGIILSYQRKWIFDLLSENSPVEMDLAPNVGGALGNIYTYLEAGLSLRFGKGLHRDYGAPAARPAQPGMAYFEPSQGFSWYIFAGVQGRLMARNIFLDGNSFEDSHSVEKHPGVGDIQSGVVLSFERYRFSILNIWRTQEFKGQNEADEYGALSFSMML